LKIAEKKKLKLEIDEIVFCREGGKAAFNFVERLSGFPAVFLSSALFQKALKNAL
jgi:hypothetical protein